MSDGFSETSFTFAGRPLKISSASFILSAPVPKGLSVNMVNAPKIFFTVSCAARAKAIPPMPSVPHNALMSTPTLLRAVTRPMIQIRTRIVRLTTGIIFSAWPSDRCPQYCWSRAVERRARTQVIRVDQPMDGDPDAQQHHGEFQGRLQGIVYDVVHPVVCAADKGFYNLPAQQGQ